MNMQTARPAPSGQQQPLLSGYELGSLALKNRMVMAPMTRSRAIAGDVPNPLSADYYVQRASAGLIITEGLPVSSQGVGYIRTPGIYSPEQLAGWKTIVAAVHQAGGKIFAQLWHVGRASHPDFHGGALPVAPSAIGATGTVFTATGLKDMVTPRALETDELPGIVEQFRKGAQNAKDAGFDGVEVHGANGYLLDEFLRDGSNLRAGPYGGPLENRARLMFEVVDAVAGLWGGDRVGLRISPLNSFNAMRDSDPVALTEHVARAAAARGLAYLHVMRADQYGLQQGDVLTPARAHFPGVLVGNVAYTGEEAERDIAAGRVDAVAFGVPFLANPDLPARIAAGAPLNAPHPETFYTPGAAGYTDYPALAAA